MFVASFAVRIPAIKLFPQHYYGDDIEIYRASGDLILHRINPYDPTKSPYEPCFGSRGTILTFAILAGSFSRSTSTTQWRPSFT